MALGKAVGTRPFNKQAVSEAASAVQKHMGYGALLEAATAAAAAECATKGVDMSGKPPGSAIENTMMKIVFFGMKTISSIRPYVGIAAVGVVAAAAVTMNASRLS